MVIASAILALSSFAAQAALPPDNGAVEKTATPAASTADIPAKLRQLPAPPRGKSTVIGGEIRSVDPVRDQFTLKVFGAKPIKILFDERTQVFENGQRVRLFDLHPVTH